MRNISSMLRLVLAKMFHVRIRFVTQNAGSFMFRCACAHSCICEYANM
jgi:hypothetical protein